MKYESFSLRIEPTAGSSYAVSVQSPQGEGQATFQLPQAPPNPGPPALDAGKELFQALFRDEVASLFHSSLASLRGRHQGLRINIAINPRRPELAPLQTLPWELLCRPETEDFLCLSRRTPVVRSLDAHRERRPAIARSGRLRILVVAASPKDCPSLDVARERTNLEEAWKGQEKNVEIVFLDRGGVEEMRQAFLAAPFHILHFMGHGKFDQESGQGVLYFERPDGTGQPFEGRRLAQLLHDFESLRLVVLNACHTAEAVGRHGANPFAGAASSLVMGGVPAVVAMSGPVSDLAAVAFSRIFYQRLAAGDPIEAAATEGRLAIQRAEPGDGAWATPTLFLRSPDGMLFAPRSTVRAPRASLLAGGIALALALVLILTLGLQREHRTAEGMRLTNDGVGLLGLGEKEKARKNLRSALRKDPENAGILGNLAVAEMQLGDDEAALVHAQAAVRAAPEEALHHYNLGNILAFKKRYEEALPSLQRAIELDPGYANAYNELGNVYLELDHTAEARKAFEAGLACDHTLATLHKNLARTALAEGHPKEAILHLEKALSLYSPVDPFGKTEATYWLAAANAAAGRTTETCAALQSFEALDPRLLSQFAKKATLLAEQRRCTPWP
jgi:tetratricopeptide (TPR) repeat protein